MLSEVQKKFVELEKQKQDHRLFFEELEAAAQAVADEIGVDGMFQDEDNTVYQIVIPEGRFVHYPRIGYTRTRRTDEKRGDLSLKKARENGFEVE